MLCKHYFYVHQEPRKALCLHYSPYCSGLEPRGVPVCDHVYPAQPCSGGSAEAGWMGSWQADLVTLSPSGAETPQDCRHWRALTAWPSRTRPGPEKVVVSSGTALCAWVARNRKHPGLPLFLNVTVTSVLTPEGDTDVPGSRPCLSWSGEAMTLGPVIRRGHGLGAWISSLFCS